MISQIVCAAFFAVLQTELPLGLSNDVRSMLSAKCCTY